MIEARLLRQVQMVNRKRELVKLDRDLTKRVCHLLTGGSLKAEGLGDGSSGQRRIRVQSHPFFGILKSSETVARQMDRLCGGRYRDL
jgi:hypothetical protein